MIRRLRDFFRTYLTACANLFRRSRIAMHMLAPVTLAAQPLHAEMQQIATAGREADGAAHVVGSILAYTRWPQTPAPVRLCVIGPARRSGQLDGALPGGVVVARREFFANAPDVSAGCDVLYFGEVAQSTIRAAVANARGRPILTIAESDPSCRSGAMFCLRFDRNVSFALNIDAITRSTIRVDPRVLRISQGY